MDESDKGNSEAPSPQEEANLDRFVQQLTNSQSNLRAYLVASLGNYEDASEVLQQTNLVLWRNAQSFRPGADFMPWALTLAKYEIMSFYRDRRRDRHVFTEEVATLMLRTASEELPDLNERFTALRECIGKLSEDHREMVRLRYEDKAPIARIAKQLARTENSIKSALVRIRQSLGNCISRRLQSNAQ